MPELLVVGGVVLIAFYVGLFTVSTIRASGALAAKSRLGVVIGFVDAVLAMIAAHVLLPWATIPGAVWFVLIGLLAVGVAGAVVRWSRLPVFGPKRRERTQSISAALQVAAAVGIAALLLML